MSLCTRNITFYISCKICDHTTKTLCYVHTYTSERINAAYLWRTKIIHFYTAQDIGNLLAIDTKNVNLQFSCKPA